MHGRLVFSPPNRAASGILQHFLYQSTFRMKYGWIFVLKKCSSWALNSKASLLKHLVRYVMPLNSTQCEIREYKLRYQSIQDYNAYSEKLSDSACHGSLVCFFNFVFIIFFFYGANKFRRVLYLKLNKSPVLQCSPMS